MSWISQSVLLSWLESVLQLISHVCFGQMAWPKLLLSWRGSERMTKEVESSPRVRALGWDGDRLRPRRYFLLGCVSLAWKALFKHSLNRTGRAWPLFPYQPGYSVSWQLLQRGRCWLELMSLVRKLNFVKQSIHSVLKWVLSFFPRDVQSSVYLELWVWFSLLSQQMSPRPSTSWER